MLFGIIKTSFR